MKKYLLLSVVTCMALLATAQKFYTRNGRIDFDATAASSPERIEAVNRTVTCILDTKSGNLQFALLVKAFQFERALMQEHFNENYLESDKYPKSEFKGTITGSESIDYQKEGRYQVRVKGKLFLHGETQEIATDAQLEIRNGRVSATAVIDVRLSDYKVSIPGLVADKVGKVAHIKVSCSLELLNN